MEERTMVEGLAIKELGEREVTLDTNHEDAIKQVQHALTDTGFRSVTTFSPANRINKYADGDLDPYTVIGFGIPEAADHALGVGDTRVGALFPCSVVVWEDESNLQHVYHINMMRVAQEIGLAPENQAWGTLIAQLERMIDDAFAWVGRPEAA